jgi:two-component system, LuxR family, sensor kinase FixL
MQPLAWPEYNQFACVEYNSKLDTAHRLSLFPSRNSREMAKMRYGSETFYGYAAGVAGVLVVSGLKISLSTVFATAFTGLFYTPAILIAAAIGGLAPGAFTTTLSLPFIYYFALRGQGPLDGVDFLLFSIVGLGISWLGGSMRDARNVALDTNTRLSIRESYLQSILDSVSDATIAIRPDGEIVSFNASAERQFGYNECEVVGQNVSRLMPELFDPARTDCLTSYLEAGRQKTNGVDRTVVGVRRDGTAFPMSLEITEIKSGGDALYIGFARDLTEGQRAASQLEETQGELARLARLSEMGEMASTLAHEINQPLAAIANYVQGSRRMLDDFTPDMVPRLRASLTEAASQSLRAGEIIHHLRAFMTRGETSKDVVDINDIIQGGSSLGLAGIKESGISVRFELLSEPAPILADTVQIQQVLIILLRNSVDAVRDQAVREIKVSTRIQGHDVITEVADTGSGLDELVAVNIFKPFNTSKSHGMGVGLSIAKRIIESHDGTITAYPREGGGTIFAFALPLVTKEGLDDE